MNLFARNKADELLQSYWNGSTPIDPFDIARRLGVTVRRESFVGNLSGVLIRKHGTTPVIAINAGDSQRRQRFTVAHELGHLVLNHKGDLFVDHTILNRRDSRSSTALDPQEIEANSFAAELLMPADLVLLKAHSLLAGIPSVSQRELLPLLSTHFGVSDQAMTYRLMNLGFLDIDMSF